MRTSLQQNVLNLLIIGLISLLLVWASPVHKYDVHGILLPAGSSDAPIKVQTVRVTNQLPVSATLIGTIHTSAFPGNGNTDNSKQLYNDSIAYAKRLAAEHGANIINVGSVINFVRAGPLNIYQLTIQAARD